MAFKYTGNADTFTFRGKIYAKPDIYAKNPKAYDGSYDDPIPGITEQFAANMSAQSNLHSFIDTKDNQVVLEKVTAPSTTAHK